MGEVENINSIDISEKPVSIYMESFSNIDDSGVRTYSVYEFRLNDFVCLIPTYGDRVYTHLARDKDDNSVSIGPKSREEICKVFYNKYQQKRKPIKIFS